MSATDIITYMWVPLAVLGVLPILYTAVMAMLRQQSIRHTLVQNGLSKAVTRGDLVSGTVEVCDDAWYISTENRLTICSRSISQDTVFNLSPAMNHMASTGISIRRRR